MDDRSPTQADAAGDFALGHSRCCQLLDVFIADHALLAALSPSFQCGLAHWFEPLALRLTVSADRRFKLLEATAQLRKRALQGFTNVLQEVPAVGNLARARRPVLCPTGILGRAVTCYHLDARVGYKPGGKSCCRSVGKHIDRLVALKVNEQGAVRMALPKREVVDAEHARGGAVRQ